MEYELVFDAAIAGYRDWSFAAGGLPLVLVPALLLAYEYRKPRPARSRWFRFYWLMVGFMLLWTVTAFAGTWSDYRELRNGLRSGNYEVVEGRVTNFVPMPKAGHAYERFTVNGRSYQYSDFEITGAFNNTSSHGGPIREGLRARIADVNGKIARLEIARPLGR